MSYVKEPGRLATINLRAILDGEAAKPAAPEKPMSGLLTPRKSPMMEMADEEILGHFFETTGFRFDKTDVFMTLVSDRLRGETLGFDIVNAKGDVIVEAGKRITARHVRELQKAKLEELKVADEYLVGKVLAKDVVNEGTGEVIAAANEHGIAMVFTGMRHFRH